MTTSRSDDAACATRRNGRISWLAIAAFTLQAVVLLVVGVIRFANVESELKQLRAELESRNEVLTTRIDERTQERYRRTEAASDKANLLSEMRLRDERIEWLRQEILRLDKEIAARPPEWLLRRLRALESQVGDERSDP